MFGPILENGNVSKVSNENKVKGSESLRHVEIPLGNDRNSVPYAVLDVDIYIHLLSIESRISMLLDYDRS